ncbi:MAG: hypothetical protein ACPG2Y_03145, partial [Acholeplasmataceae bacterium]
MAQNPDKNVSSKELDSLRVEMLKKNFEKTIAAKNAEEAKCAKLVQELEKNIQQRAQAVKEITDPDQQDTFAKLLKINEWLIKMAMNISNVDDVAKVWFTQLSDTLYVSRALGNSAALHTYEEYFDTAKVLYEEAFDQVKFTDYTTQIIDILIGLGILYE